MVETFRNAQDGNPAAFPVFFLFYPLLTAMQVSTNGTKVNPTIQQTHTDSFVFFIRTLPYLLRNRSEGSDERTINQGLLVEKDDVIIEVSGVQALQLQPDHEFVFRYPGPGFGDRQQFVILIKEAD